MTLSVLWLTLTLLWNGLRCVIVVVSDHTHLIFCVWSLFCDTVLSLLSIFLNHVAEEERATCFTLYSCCCVRVYVLPCFFLVVPRVGLLSVICDFSWSY